MGLIRRWLRWGRRSWRWGPAFRKGAVIGECENVDVYNLVCRVLGVKPAENDGARVVGGEGCAYESFEVLRIRF